MTKEGKAALVAECRASGMTAREWCRQQGIKYSQYCGWATRVNREERQGESLEWANVTLNKENNSSGEIKIHCGNLTINVEPGFNPTLLADILKVVHALC